MIKQLKIGIIGMGRIGKLHGNNLVFSVPNAKIEAVADVFLNEEMRTWAQGLGIDKIYDNPVQIFSNPAIEAVFICSSSAGHAELIIQAAAAKKHIFCEKPIHTDVDQIRKALAAVEKAGVKLQVGFMRRFDHNHKKVKDILASDRMGKPHIVKVTSRDPEKQPIEYISTSGGIFLDMTIHDFDMARYLSGSEVTEVTAIGAIKIDERIREFSDVDTAIVLLKFENGAIGVIDNSRAAHYGYDQRVEVHCDKGCVQNYNDLIDTTVVSTKDGVYSERPKWFFLERYNQAFIAEAQEFVAAVLNDTEPSVTGIDGLMPVLIAKAAQKSLDEGRTVKLTEFV
jgi:myo-inositol 2-dehydrogenase/D-chiro-inositol 1-dehydrogenase